MYIITFLQIIISIVYNKEYLTCNIIVRYFPLSYLVLLNCPFIDTGGDGQTHMGPRETQKGGNMQGRDRETHNIWDIQTDG